MSFFKDEDKKNYATNILNLPATGASGSRATKGAIGYIGLAYETKEVNN
jgi:phosphate transport system substrate-binding protein